MQKDASWLTHLFEKSEKVSRKANKQKKQKRVKNSKILFLKSSFCF